jgi:hypothetical protein
MKRIALPHTPASHFRLLFYDAILALRERLPDDIRDAGFLGAYAAEAAGETSSAEGFRAAVSQWERAGPELPLAQLGLDALALRLLFTVGLVEEDARFGLVWEAVDGAPGQQRPTASLLAAWAADGAARRAIRDLVRLGLVETGNAADPAGSWELRVAPLVWDAARGELARQPAPWLRYEPPEGATALDRLVLNDGEAAAVALAPGALAAGTVGTLVVRGPQSSGRRTLLGAIARELGRGVLTVDEAAVADDRWRSAGPLATLLHALPVCVLDLAPGASVELRALPAYDGPVGVVTGRQGGLSGAAAEGAVVPDLRLPGPAARTLHWRDALGAAAGEAPAGARMTGGNIRRTAELARAAAALAGREAVTAADLRAGARMLHGRLLDTLAERVRTEGGWSQLAVRAETMRELELVESRCRHRERLAGAVGPALAAGLGPGVRALFSGPSGTGKTLAAALLAAQLGVDLYRLDLSGVVNKYLGETEKNLSRVFARAEEADVALLLDEGDALLTQRTAVHTANDRYANLETNYLLQRLESYEGILIVTTNAGDRIDGAFKRRMDVVVEFRLPDAAERWAIWQLHLPPLHEVDTASFDELVARCELSGGQIRNAVLHASLLALDDGVAVGTRHLRAAIAREYAKSGEVCPLRAEAFAYG